MSLVKVFYKVEISDHDHYCSGNECEYEEEIREREIDSPQFLDDLIQECGYNVGDEICELKDFRDDQMKYLIYKLDYEYEMKYPGGSCACYLSDECKKHNLKRHEYRIIIEKIEVINRCVNNK